MSNVFLTALRVFLLMTVVTGVFYTATVTVIAQTLFADQANGSLVANKNGAIIGSSLLAQKFESPNYFWPRPSAGDYGTVPSGASNQAPTSEAFKKAVQERKDRGLSHELLFASGSGLDPHISLDAALTQLPRVAQSRHLNEDGERKLKALIEQAVEKRDFGFLGEKRINVLMLNMKLDDLVAQ